MALFGRIFVKKSEWEATKAKVVELADELVKRDAFEKTLKRQAAAIEADRNGLISELDTMKKAFPFIIGQVVYDVQLKNAQGRFTKKHPSFEQSSVNAVEVTAANYFKLVARLASKDVFFEEAAATEHIRSLCEDEA